MLRNPLSPGAENYRVVIEAAAAKLGLSAHLADARGRRDLEPAFASLVQSRVDALVVHADPMFFTARAQVVQLAAQHRLPSTHQAREYVEAGALISYAPNIASQFRGAATYVDKILRGARPSELPIQAPAVYELAINLATAKSLGVTVSPALRMRADWLVE